MNLINKLELDKILHKKHLEKYSDEVFNEILNIIKNGLENKIKELKNKERVNKNDDSKPKIKAIEYLNKKEIEILPKWVKNDIDKAVIIGKSKQVIQLENGKKYHLKNKLNDLSGAEWNYFLNSVLCTRYKTSGKDSYAHEIRKEHPSPKPPQLMRDIISFFTKEDELVFDYFAGVGGTLLGSSLCNRKAIGFDLSDRYKDIYMKANKNLDLKEQKFICGDSLELLKNNNLMQNLFKLVIEHFTTAKSIYENHAGCERGYFFTPTGEAVAVKKYEDRDRYKSGDKSAKIAIPDLVISDIDRSEIINIEGKKFIKVDVGIKELSDFDAFEKIYISHYYPNARIIRSLVLFGSSENEISEVSFPKLSQCDLVKIGFVLNENGKMILQTHSPEIFKEALKNLYSFYGLNF